MNYEMTLYRLTEHLSYEELSNLWQTANKLENYRLQRTLRAIMSIRVDEMEDDEDEDD